MVKSLSNNECSEKIETLISNSALFDWKFYVKEHNLDINNLHDAVKHFISFGFFRNYACSLDLSIKYSVKKNNLSYTYSDLSLIFQRRCKLYSYQYEYISEYGKFDYEWYSKYYLSSIPEIDPLLHYLQSSALYAPNEDFSRYCYVELNPNIKLETMDPYFYHIKYGYYNSDIIVKDFYFQCLLLSNYFDIDQYKIAHNISDDSTAIEHYLNFGISDEEVSDLFDASIYSEKNDIHDMPALIHFFKRGFSHDQLAGVYPQNAKKLVLNNLQKNEVQKKRALLFASYSNNGVVSKETLFLLKELKRYVDCIFFVSDSPLIEKSALEVLDIVDSLECKRHRMYDFGSYSIAWKNFVKNYDVGIFDEVLLANDSILGPFKDIEGFFEESKNNAADLFGLTINNYGYLNSESNGHSIFQPHIQTYFVLLKKRFFRSKCWEDFISSVSHTNCKKQIVIDYEMGLSRVAISNGFKIDCYYKSKHGINPSSRDFYDLAEKTGFMKKAVLPKYDEAIVNYIFERYKYPFIAKDCRIIDSREILFDCKCNLINIIKKNEVFYLIVRVPRNKKDELKICAVDKELGSYLFIEKVDFIDYGFSELQHQIEENEKYTLIAFKFEETLIHSKLNHVFYIVDENNNALQFSAVNKKHYMHHNFFVVSQTTRVYITDKTDIYINYIENCDDISLSNKQLFKNAFEKKIDGGLILFAEKGNLMADNAFELFQYLVKNNVELGKKSYYLVDSKEEFIDCDKLIYEHLVERNSKEHLRVFDDALLLIFSFDYYNLIPDSYPEKKLSFFLRDKRLLCISHGYSGGYNNSIAFGMLERGTDISIVSSSKYETDYMKSVGYETIYEYGYPRFDKWCNVEIHDNQLCVFFTFRRNALKISEYEFVETIYFKKILNLMKELSSKAPNIKIKYVFHNALKKYQRDFIRANLLVINPNIDFIDNEDEVCFNKTLKESKYLLTDYSSVGFDFAYNKDKLSIFYVETSFTEGHYRLTDSFDDQIAKLGGWVAYSLEDILKALRHKDSHCTSLFSFYDSHNCERLIEVVDKELYFAMFLEECQKVHSIFYRYIVGKNYITIKWKKLENAKGYRILRRNENDDYCLLVDIDNNNILSFIDYNVQLDEKYLYKIVAYGDDISYSFEDELFVCFTNINSNVSITSIEQGNNIEWGAVSWSSKYYVYRKEDKGKWEKICETDATHFVDGNVKEHVSYRYAIKCASVDGNGVYNMT